MTARLTANAYYTGSNSVPSDTVVADTAAALYTAYAARVTADGGTVNSPTDCQAAIQAALVGDYWWRIAAAVSPDWGYKTSGSAVTKFYSLKGAIDGVKTGVNTITLDTTTFTKPLAVFGSGTTMTFTGLNVLAANADGLAMLSVLDVASGNALDQAVFTPASDQWKLLNTGGAGFPEVVVAGVAKFFSNPEYSNGSLIAHALAVQMGTQRITGIQNGTQKKCITGLSGGFTPLVPGAAADVVYSIAPGMMGEWWFFNNVSDLPGLQAITTATADVTARY